MKVQVSNANTPVWRDITVESRMPEQLNVLQEMARNIWWVWNNESLSMFKSIDPEIWKAVNGNPVMLLNRVSYERLEEIVADKAMMYTINAQYEKFRKYIDEKPNGNLPSIAYFSMEYGLANVLKIYSGGLGILAGDYLKEASDSNIDMVAVGFLYRYGYFTQTLSMDGQQLANYEPQNFNQLPIEQVVDENGHPIILEVPYPAASYMPIFGV